MSITIQHTQEELSKSYVAAVAAKAGVKCSWETMDYGFDARIMKVNAHNGRHLQSPYSINLQLKSSKNWSATTDDKHIIYDLEAKTFNDLVQVDPDGEGAFLILMCLPKNDDDWLDINHERMLLKNCCYWWKQTNPATENTSSVRINIPKDNLLNMDAMISILDNEELRRKGAFK